MDPKSPCDWYKNHLGDRDLEYAILPCSGFVLKIIE